MRFQISNPPSNCLHLKFKSLFLTLVCQPFDAHCCHIGTAIKHPVPDRVKQSFVIFDILALWRLLLWITSCQLRVFLLHRSVWQCNYRWPSTWVGGVTEWREILPKASWDTVQLLLMFTTGSAAVEDTPAAVAEPSCKVDINGEIIEDGISLLQRN